MLQPKVWAALGLTALGFITVTIAWDLLTHGRDAAVANASPLMAMRPLEASSVAPHAAPAREIYADVASTSENRVAIETTSAAAPVTQGRDVSARLARRFGVPAGETIHRICRVTAYHDIGTTASGVPSGVGQCAAPADIPFGSRIYVPALDRTFVVTDRTHRRFRRSTVDIFMPVRRDCVEFGLNFLEVEITLPK